MTSPDAERRAHDLLQWVPYSLPTEFDPELAEQGHYTALQRERSDRALDAWDKAHPHETSPELAAFQELERLGIYSQAVFYSPAKAKDGYYTRRLRDHLSTSSAPRASGPAGSHRKARRRRPL